MPEFKRWEDRLEGKQQMLKQSTSLLMFDEYKDGAATPNFIKRIKTSYADIDIDSSPSQSLSSDED